MKKLTTIENLDKLIEVAVTAISLGYILKELSKSVEETATKEVKIKSLIGSVWLLFRLESKTIRRGFTEVHYSFQGVE